MGQNRFNGDGSRKIMKFNDLPPEIKAQMEAQMQGGKVLGQPQGGSQPPPEIALLMKANHIGGMLDNVEKDLDGLASGLDSTKIDVAVLDGLTTMRKMVKALKAQHNPNRVKAYVLASKILMGNYESAVAGFENEFKDATKEALKSD